MGRRWVFLKSRQQVLPDEVEFLLHVRRFGGDDYHCILIGHYNNILPESAICAVGVVSAAPHLVTITLFPVAGILFGLWQIGVLNDFERGGFLYPCCRKHLFAMPDTFLQEQLTEFGHVFRFDPQAPAAHIDVHRIYFPVHTCDAQWRK